MPRQCATCAHPQVLTINQRLRSGDKATAIAADFGLSPDSCQRHRQGHLRPKSSPESIARTTDLTGRLETLWTAASTLLDNATASGNVRAQADALMRLSGILDAMEKARSRPTVSVFESLTVSEKVAAIRADGPLMLALVDAIMRDFDLAQKHGQQADSVH